MNQAKLNSIEEIRPENSGLKIFVKKDFQSKLKAELLNNQSTPLSDNTDYVKLLALFLFEKNLDLKLALEDKPELVASSEIKALKILNLLKLQEKVTKKTVFPFESQDLLLRKKLANELSSKIIDLYFSIQRNTEIFSKEPIELWSLVETIPELFYHLAKQKLILNDVASFSRIEAQLPEKEKLDEVEDTIFELAEMYQLEKAKLLFIKILLYTRLGEKDLVENLLVEYHKIYKPDFEKKSKLIPMGVQSYYQAEQILKNWGEVLKEASTIQNEIETLAQILPSTCDYFSCSDCCSHTFPTMSYTEYLYLKKWMQENGIDESKIIEKSEAIQKDYEEKFSERLKIIDKAEVGNQIRGIENPHDYKFSCPFLSDEGKCSCHPARPLLCRGFGTATNNGVSIKTCNYYLRQYQYNASPENERYVFDMRPMEMLIRSSDQYFYKQCESFKQEPKGTIVAWFSQDTGAID